MIKEGGYLIMKVNKSKLADLEIDYVKYRAIKKLNWFENKSFLQFLDVAVEIYDWDFWLATENLMKSSQTLIFGEKIDYNRLKSYAFASVMIQLLTEDLSMILSLPDGYEKWLVDDDENDEAYELYNNKEFFRNMLSKEFLDLDDDIMYFLESKTF